MACADPIPVADPPVPAHPADARAMIEAQLAMLSRLAEIGMGIAEDAGRLSHLLADGGEADDGLVDPGLTYTRVARAVRLTIALQSRLLADRAALDAGEQAARTEEKTRRRDRIRRLVGLAIDAEHADFQTVGRLSYEAQEHLRDEDDFEDLLAGPLGEAVTRICTDLGLSPDWSGTPFAPLFADAGDGASPIEEAPFPLADGGRVGDGGARVGVTGNGSGGAARDPSAAVMHPPSSPALPPSRGKEVLSG